MLMAQVDGIKERLVRVTERAQVAERSRWRARRFGGGIYPGER